MLIIWNPTNVDYMEPRGTERAIRGLNWNVIETIWEAAFSRSTSPGWLRVVANDCLHTQTPNGVLGKGRRLYASNQ